ncbi:MAG: dihydrodipicolinate synthase family protein [Verrucomicrobia bacterium]|nr:dihydrodipicolinate synthase family protein [Verrucomicrobiota bacterium]
MKNPSSEDSLPDGIYAAALTPMHADLSCNTQELSMHCLDLLQRGCQGVVLFGTTGEGPSFSLQERLAVTATLIENGVPPQKIILGNGGSNIPETVELAKACLKHGCLALLASPPPFFKNVPEEGVIAFYREIIRKVDDPHLRIILYHIPQFTGVPITLRTIQTLREEFPETVIGLKESEGNLPFAKQVFATLPGFKVFVGSEEQIIEAVHEGGSGAICGLANLYPELICSLFNLGQQGLLENPQELTHFFASMKGYPFIPAFKAVMEWTIGDGWHDVRPPLVPLSAQQKEAFISKLNDYTARG